MPAVRVRDYRTPIVDGLFIATVATVTLAKLQWEVAGTLSLSDIVTALFLVAFAWTRFERSDGQLPRCAMVALAFFVAFLVVYLIGFFNLETSQALGQWAKGMFKFVLHFLFLVAGVALVTRDGPAVLLADARACSRCGLALNGLYGLMQLAYAELRAWQSRRALRPAVTGGDSQINIYGAIEGQNVFRVNALTGDPNHLGIELSVPILILLPIYLRMERGNPWRLRILSLVSFLAIVQLATLSRSGILGLLAGLIVLAMPYHRLLFTPRFLVPLGVLAVGDPRLHRATVGVLAPDPPQSVRDRGQGDLDAPRGLRLHSRRARDEPVLRARAQQLLRVLRVHHRSHELRPSFVLRGVVRRDRDRRRGAVRGRSSCISSVAQARHAASASGSRRSVTRSPRVCGRSAGGSRPRSSRRSSPTSST